MADHNTAREFDIISKYFRPLVKGVDEALGLADDAAVLSVPPTHQLVVTTDAIVEGVHFLPSLSAEDVAYKLVGVNLSDLAAMGATPKAVFLAAQFTSDTCEAWIEAFAAGLKAALAPSGAQLMGGDTVSTPGPLAFTLTALGYVKTGQALKRSGAQVGDMVFATGTIGDGALGLAVLRGELESLPPQHADHLAGRYARPEPRWAFGQALAELGLVTACVDVSDGLVADLNHICTASGVAAIVEAGQVMLSDAANAVVETSAERLKDVLTGGDDYELVFTAPSSALGALEELAETMQLPLSIIGRIEAAVSGGDGLAGQRVRVLDDHGTDLELGAGGYQHL
jgi:thiamine-monophosphate kinase